VPDNDDESQCPSTPPLKPSTPSIDPSDIWSGDALEREKVANALTNLVKPERSPLVVTLNGGWGTGKTYFLLRWKLALEKAKLKAIYFNAWEDDYCGDPLVAIIGQLKEDLGQQYKIKMEAVVKAAKNVSIRAALKVVRTATGELVDIQTGDFKSKRGKIFDEYKEERNGRTELNTALVALTEEVKKETQGPLVFIVDELDRCRPTFAIELLERVKHLFGIPNIVFVLGLDRTQLGSSVKSVYGDIDEDGYLRRFFDLEFSLPPCNAEVFCSGQLKRHGLDEYAQGLDNINKQSSHGEHYRTVESILPFLCRAFGLSLRDVESLVRSYVVTIRNMEGRIRNWPVLLSVLLVLRLKNHRLYTDFTSGRIAAKTVLDYIESHFDTLRSDKSDEDSYKEYRIAATVYLSIPAEFANRSRVFEELKRLLEDGNTDPQYSHLSGRTLAFSIEQRDRFRDIFNAERNGSIVIGPSTKRSIDSLLKLIELSG